MQLLAPEVGERVSNLGSLSQEVRCRVVRDYAMDVVYGVPVTSGFVPEMDQIK